MERKAMLFHKLVTNKGEWIRKHIKQKKERRKSLHSQICRQKFIFSKVTQIVLKIYPALRFNPEPRVTDSVLDKLFKYRNLVLDNLQYQTLLVQMRYIMKGGVWKNSQDEILKAAIMKYGLNQWSRISSLLQRKSAKQCKQRWYEWLDPSIKKTEWTRTQDEKLLQLARVFPSQWRTIAPFVGRTSTQCYDRYEKLLDIAQGKNPNDPNDLRKLRPGEIDPNPQTKPARPDPIDMDEDQKEMLAQVRVRLANTKGKKAKRKQREKIIDEARRLAQLQKARELKMAGVQNIITQQELKRLKQKKDIDYNKQVPFKRQVPDFVFKTQQSQTPASSAFALNITLQAMEGKKREVDQEIKQKIDKRRIKKFKEKDMSAAIMQRRELAKPPPVPINLPTPQLGDRDLEQLKKLNITTPLNTHLMGQTPMGMTPENKIMLSARVNLSLNYKDMADQDEDDEETLERLKYLKAIESQQASKRPIEPNFKPLSERIKTPVNEWEKEDTGKLLRLLKRIPKAENIVQFEIPEEDEDVEKQQVFDAEEYQRIQAEKQEQIQAEKLKTRSEVLKKGLPRVRSIPNQVFYYKRNPILKMIEDEYISLIYSDAVDYPLEEGIEFPEKQIPYRQPIDKSLLHEAQSLIQEQMQKKQNPYRFNAMNSIGLHHQIKLNSKKMQVQVQRHDVINDFRVRYQANYQQYNNEVKKSNLLEKKCNVSLAGFEKILKDKTTEVNSLISRLSELKIQRKSLEQLRQQEQQAISTRMQEMQNYYKLMYDSL